MDMIRTFVAIELPDNVKRALLAAQEQLADAVPPGMVRWVKPKAMHLTVRFLGQTDVRLLPHLARAMDDSLSLTPAFTLHLGALTGFPNRGRPRTIVVSIDHAPSAHPLATLRERLDVALTALGIAAETKPFNPHLTLGRVRRGQSPGPLPPLAVPDQTFVVAAVHLIESDLRPDGPLYTTRHTTALAPAP